MWCCSRCQPCSASYWPLWKGWAGRNGQRDQISLGKQASHSTFFHVYFLLFFFSFSVKCPGSSITYKHDSYRGVGGEVGRRGLTGDGEAPLLTTQGRARALCGHGMFQHLPEAVWPPLPPVLRTGMPLDSGIPLGPQAHWTHCPCALNPEASVVPESPCQLLGVPSFPLPPDPRGGREGRGRGAQVSPPWLGRGRGGLE